MDASTGTLTVLPVPAFNDNYLWLLVRGSNAVVVDPGDAAPVERALAERGLTLRAILLTHHHADHVGGVAALTAARRGDRLEVYGPAGESIAGVTTTLVEGDRIAIDAIGLSFDVLDVPGHTRGHIAYVSVVTGDEAPLLFCGDTLFAAGCGRLFEGTADQMHASLGKLAALPAATKVYCAHEYTLNNLRFARAVEPGNEALIRRSAEAAATRDRGEPTLPSTIALERATNPFLRVECATVRAAVDRRTAEPSHADAADSPVATFAALRRWKDAF
jgi:hydroxyacylglutathione hydrolase